MNRFSSSETIKRVLQEQKLRIAEEESEKKKKEEEEKKSESKKEDKPSPHKELASNMIVAALDMAPVTGTYRSGERAVDAYKKGEYGQAALHGGLTALSAVGDAALFSGVGTAAGALIKGAVGAAAGKLAKKGLEKAASGEAAKAVSKVTNKPPASADVEMPKFKSNNPDTSAKKTSEPANDAAKVKPAKSEPGEPTPTPSSKGKNANDNEAEEIVMKQGNNLVKVKPEKAEPPKIEVSKDPPGVTRTNPTGKPANDTSATPKPTSVPAKTPTVEPSSTPFQKQPAVSPAKAAPATAKAASSPEPISAPGQKSAVKPNPDPVAKPNAKTKDRKSGKKDGRRRRLDLPSFGGSTSSNNERMEITHANKRHISKASSRLKFEGVSMESTEVKRSMDKVNQIADWLKAETKKPVEKLPDINAPGVPEMFKVKKSETVKEAAASVIKRVVKSKDKNPLVEINPKLKNAQDLDDNQ